MTLYAESCEYLIPYQRNRNESCYVAYKAMKFEVCSKRASARICRFHWDHLVDVARIVASDQWASDGP